MPKHPHTTSAAHLNRAQMVISNTLADRGIQEPVAAFGFTPAKLKEGRKLFEAAQASLNAQTAAAGAQREATAEADWAREIARLTYQSLAQVARAVLADDKAKLHTLGLTGAMPRSAAAFLTAAGTLFDNAAGTPEIQAMLQEYGYGLAKLKKERLKVEQFDTANQARQAAMGAAQQATQDQLAALNRLNHWVSQYLKIARVAMHDKPQLLEKLGIAVRTEKVKARRASRKKVVPLRKPQSGPQT